MRNKGTRMHKCKLRILLLSLAIFAAPSVTLARGHSSGGFHAAASHGSSRHSNGGNHSNRAQGVPRNAHDRIARSAKARDTFKHAHPCPSTGRKSGACPGYVIDHVVPLCAGGPDAPVNMQWQSKVVAARKDILEKRRCALLRRRAGL